MASAQPIRVLVFALVLVMASTASAQVRPDSTTVDSLGTDAGAAFEAILEDEEAGDPTELLERLEDLQREPLDVNAASADDLAEIPALGPLLAAAIVRHRAANGPFTSLPGLRDVEGMSADVYLDARPFLTIGPRLETSARASGFAAVPSWRTMAAGLNYTATQRFQRRLDTAQGFVGDDSTRAYPGSPERIYTRIQATYRRQLSLNVTLEKDPGEAFRWNPDQAVYGYDHVTGHAAIMGVGRIDALIVGDFVAEYGQGVALWRSSGFGKGPDAVGGPSRSGRGLRPYGSVDENGFFRGAAVSVGVLPSLYVSAFGSRRTLDASVTQADTLDLFDPDLPTGAFVTSLGADGLHRTESELARKDVLGETLFGGGAEVRRATRTVVAQLGVVATRSSFDTPLGGGTRPDQLFQFAGDVANTISAYADVRVRGGQFFGEAARGPGGGFGGVAGVSADLGGGLDVLLLGRRYDPNFSSLHGYPFGERNGAANNESGVYLGARLKPSRNWTINAYVDQYRFPFLRFNVPRPSQGHEALVLVEHRPRRYLRWYIQARTETKDASIDVPGSVPGSIVGGLAPTTRQTARVHGDWDANRSLRLRARAEVSRFVPTEGVGAASTGALVYQDVRLQTTRWLRVDARMTLFRAEDYGARLYAFENDIAGVFAIPTLSGRGTRAYLLFAATPTSAITIQAKIAGTWFRGVRSIGSGNSEIAGNRVRDAGLLLRYKF